MILGSLSNTAEVSSDKIDVMPVSSELAANYSKFSGSGKLSTKSVPKTITS